MAGATPRVVVVTRMTELAALLAHHGTLGQARFFLETRGRSLDEVQARDRKQQWAEHAVLAAIPTDWRRASVDREDLARFLFEPEDIVVAVGQDGLVANTAKYLDGQRVIGIDPEPRRNPGVLVQHRASRIEKLLASATAPDGDVEERTMVEASLDDGQVLRAVNEVFIGHRSHQSARYRLSVEGGRGVNAPRRRRRARGPLAWDPGRTEDGSERQSSSGVVVTTGTGATGWASSIVRSRIDSVELLLPEPDEPRLCFFVREAWPSPATGTRLVDGSLRAGQALLLVSEMDEGGVVFGDGIEADHLDFTWGQTVRVGLSGRALRLVH